MTGDQIDDRIEEKIREHEQREDQPSHAALMATILAVGRIARVAAGGAGIAIVAIIGSCVGTRDLIRDDHSTVERHEKEIVALHDEDRGQRAILMQINGEVQKISGALGIRSKE